MSAAGVDGDVTGAGDKRARGRVFPVFLTDFAGFCLPRVFFFYFAVYWPGRGARPFGGTPLRPTGQGQSFGIYISRLRRLDLL